MNTGLWSGLFVPAGTPAPIVEKLEETLRRVIADPRRAELKAWRSIQAAARRKNSAMIDADIKTTADVVKAANLEFKE